MSIVGTPRAPNGKAPYATSNTLAARTRQRPNVLRHFPPPTGNNSILELSQSEGVSSKDRNPYTLTLNNMVAMRSDAGDVKNSATETVPLSTMSPVPRSSKQKALYRSTSLERHLSPKQKALLRSTSLERPPSQKDLFRSTSLDRPPNSRAKSHKALLALKNMRSSKSISPPPSSFSRDLEATLAKRRNQVNLNQQVRGRRRGPSPSRPLLMRRNSTDTELLHNITQRKEQEIKFFQRKKGYDRSSNRSGSTYSQLGGPNIRCSGSAITTAGSSTATTPPSRRGALTSPTAPNTSSLPKNHPIMKRKNRSVSPMVARCTLVTTLPITSSRSLSPKGSSKQSTRYGRFRTTSETSASSSTSEATAASAKLRRTCRSDTDLCSLSPLPPPLTARESSGRVRSRLMKQIRMNTNADHGRRSRLKKSDSSDKSSSKNWSPALQESNCSIENDTNSSQNSSTYDSKLSAADFGSLFITGSRVRRHCGAPPSA